MWLPPLYPPEAGLAKTGLSSDFSSWACRILSNSRRVITFPFALANEEEGDVLPPPFLFYHGLCVQGIPLLGNVIFSADATPGPQCHGNPFPTRTQTADPTK